MTEVTSVHSTAVANKVAGMVWILDRQVRFLDSSLPSWFSVFLLLGFGKFRITFTLDSILPLYSFFFPFKTMELIVKSQPTEQKQKMGFLSKAAALAISCQVAVNKSIVTLYYHKNIHV